MNSFDNYVNYTKIVIMGENPEKIARDYIDKDIIIVYPKNKRPSAELLLRKNIRKIFSDYRTFPDIESLKIIRDVIFYLLNTNEISKDDYILIIFKKEGEEYKLSLNLSSLNFISLLDILKERVKGEIVQMVLRLSMNIVKRGNEGRPAGALFVIGDAYNVKKYIIQKIANPISSLQKGERNILSEDNFETIREFATMDGATIIDDSGYVISCGAYIKNLVFDDWIANGKGGRHLAAQSITKLTKAISFVVSSEGIIRVYKDGEEVYELANF